MSDRLRRQKDNIKKTLSTYLEASTVDYAKYLEGSPTYVTYYQYDAGASKQDVSLEAVHTIIGANAPRKYKRIYEMPIYGVDALEISTELAERGLLSSISGEFIVLPKTIRPSPDDFICFEDYDGLETHLFRITDVQQDKLTPNKYYKASFSLYPDNVDNVFGNVIGDYQVEYNENGGSATGTDTISIVSAADAASNEASKNLVDGLIDKYVKLFYSEDMDTFVCRVPKEEGVPGDYTYYWSPYLQHFLHETKALSKYKNEILTEIYISDINETENPDIYSEEVYRDSILRKIEMKDREITFDMNFMVFQDYNLKMPRNLPFFMSPYDYKLITPVLHRADIGFPYAGAFPIFLNTQKTFGFTNSDSYRVQSMNELGEEIAPQMYPWLDHIKTGDIIYEAADHIHPTKIAVAEAVESFDEATHTVNTDIEIRDGSIVSLMNSKTLLISMESKEIFSIIRNYLNGKFQLTDDVVDVLENLYYKSSIQNYLFIPILLFILKDTLSVKSGTNK